jgi:hypothetical protein
MMGENQMKALTFCLAVLVMCCTGVTAFAQDVKLGPEHDIFKTEVGSWDCEIKQWMGEGEPAITKGTETNTMMGGWLITNFQANLFGNDFKGHGAYTYDPEIKKYKGVWMDSMGPAIMNMTGEYDKATETMTYTGEGPGPDGSPMLHILATKIKDGKRVMTMHMKPKSGGEAMKLMEVTYSKKAAK